MERNNNDGNPVPKGGRLAFGIFMILFYVAVGLLCIFDVFNILTPTVSYVTGGLLIAYGIWRGVRLFKGWG